MNGIDDIIARSRARGGFIQKGAFTLASDKARMKVSEFALPDPFMYCLEYLQSAVALHAAYLDAAVNSTTFILSMCGVHYTRENLERMFDFLLATNEDDYARAHQRLAVGTSAALSLPGASVVIESGDGTEEGSCRFEITSIQGEAVIGTPDSPIDGTFIKVAHGSMGNAFDGTTLEESLITARCKYLPVTLVLNGEMPFGYAFSREVKLSLYQHHIGFDDGDLYGGLALDDGSAPPMVEGIRILTNGVEISSIPSPVLAGKKGEDSIHVVGIVTYDRLHKSASQYEIIQDDRLSELRQRLKPFVHQLLVEAGASNDARLSYLLDLKAPHYRPKGTPYRIKIQQKPFEIQGTFAFTIPVPYAPGMRLSVVYETEEHHLKSIQFLGFEFPMPVAGRIILKGDCIDALGFLRPGDPDFTLGRTVVLTPEAKNVISDAVKSHFQELIRHLTAQRVLWQQQQDNDAEKASKPTARGTASDAAVQTALQIANQAPMGTDAPPPRCREDTPVQPSETGEEFKYSSNADEQLRALLERRDALMQGAVVIDSRTPEPKVPTGTPSRGSWALPPIDTTAPKASPSRRRIPTMPTPDEIRARLSTPSDTRDIYNAICTFLRRILRADPVCRRVFEQSQKGITLVEATPQSYCAWVDTTPLKDHGKFNSYLYVNRFHPLISKWIDESIDNPMQIFAMALLVRNDIVAQINASEKGRRFEGAASGLGTAIVEHILQPARGEAIPGSAPAVDFN